MGTDSEDNNAHIQGLESKSPSWQSRFLRDLQDPHLERLELLGGVDEVTQHQYLEGELPPHEMERVRVAMENHPELRSTIEAIQELRKETPSGHEASTSSTSHAENPDAPSRVNLVDRSSDRPANGR